jgi:AraC family transcriptional regulator of adaptative response / DNA-3-methyladenine glycosylase II
MGTYHLPSCPTMVGRRSVALFESEAMAKAAGFRPCRTCKPERFHGQNGGSLVAFRNLAAVMSVEPAAITSLKAASVACGIAMERLRVILADHAQMTPESWLDRQRVFFATRQLIGSRATDGSLAAEAGFLTVADYERVFTRHMALTPGEYRKAMRSTRFRLRLPTGYRANDVLAYQGRDPEGLAERVTGRHIDKALSTSEGPAILHLEPGTERCDVAIECARPLSEASVAELHIAALKILGLFSDIASFEAAHPTLVAGHQGLHVPLIPSAFDALCWAIVGQQINLSFAGSLRRHLIEVAGTPVGRMKTHPSPEAIANLDPSTLRANRFSGSKVRYLQHAAEAVASGQVDLEDLWKGSAVEAETKLTSLHGVGTWTARYVLMRIGFGDAAPVGDSGLSTALQRIDGLPGRPDAGEVARLMARYAPWRSLASAHLWASLHD